MTKQERLLQLLKEEKSAKEQRLLDLLKKQQEQQPENLSSKINSIEAKIDEVKKQKGEQGDKGDKGDNGIDGKDGKNGLDGKNGKDGTNGKDGRDGKDGKNGIDGKDGIDGINGKDGKDGSPDMAEDIRNKLELLTGDERLKLDAISGFDTFADDIKGNVNKLSMSLDNHRVLGIKQNGQRIGQANELNFIGATIKENGEQGVDIKISSDLSGYVPYTGATNNVDLGNYLLFASGINLGSGSINGSLRYSEPISNNYIDTYISTDDGFYTIATKDGIKRLSLQQDGKFLFESGNTDYPITLVSNFTFDGEAYITNGIIVQGKVQMGYYASTAFVSGVAIGSQAISGADGAFALGAMAQAQGDNSTAIGYNSYAGGTFDLSFSAAGYVETSFASSTIMTVGDQIEISPYLSQDNTFYIFGDSKTGSDTNKYPALGGIGTNLTPRSLWEVGGSYGAKLEEINTDFTCNETTNVVVMTGGSYVYLEPADANSKWRQHTIINATDGNITLHSHEETIGNYNKTTDIIIKSDQSITVESDGNGNWYIISNF